MTSETSRHDPAFMAAYGETIQQLRIEKQLDRKALAVTTGISYSYLSAIESGQKVPSDSLQTILAKVLGFSSAALLARVNGALVGEEPTGETGTATPLMAAEIQSIRSGPNHRASGLSTSAALAELDTLVPSLSSEDAAMVVAMARRLATHGEAGRRSRAAEAQHRGKAGRELRTTSYLRFWSMYLDGLTTRDLDWSQGRKPLPRSYFTTPSPIKGSSMSASFARNRQLRHEMYINRGSREANLQLLDQLRSHRQIIESVYGQRLDFEDPGRERRALRIAEYREGHISQSDQFPEYVDWFIDRGIRLRKAIDASLTAT